MERNRFRDEHDHFRRSFRAWVEKEIVPFRETWEEANIVPRDLWRQAGAQGFLCPWLEEKWGGAGADFLYSVIVMEELARAYESGFAMALHSDIVVPYLHAFGNDEQKRRWLPGCASGELVTAIAMTEPGTGSDLAAIANDRGPRRRRLRHQRSKTFISNGQLCDLVVVAAKTDPDPRARTTASRSSSSRPEPRASPRARGSTRWAWRRRTPRSSLFEDCRVPAANLLGDEGAGFMMLMQKLQQERLCVAIGGAGQRRAGARDTIAYSKERKAFGKPISKFQNTQFKLVECATKVEVGRAFLDKLVAEHVAGKTSSRSARWRSSGRPTCSARSSTPACSSSAATATCSSTR